MASKVNESREVMAKSLIEMLNFSITIPLTDLTKDIHTNSFIKLNKKLFDADYLWKIYKAMGSTDASRNVSFRQNYWYVAETEVNYKNKTMKLKLLALPSVPNYSKDDMNADKSKNTNKSETETSASSSVNLRGDSFCQSIAKQAIGTASNDLTRANKCVEAFNSKHTYSLYYDFHHGKNFKATWNSRGLNCGDGAVCLCNLLYTIGLEPKMHLGSAGAIGEQYGHYWVEVKIDNKTYYVDHANCTGCKGRAKLRTSGTDYGHNPRAGSIVSWK